MRRSHPWLFPARPALPSRNETVPPARPWLSPSWAGWLTAEERSAGRARFLGALGRPAVEVPSEEARGRLLDVGAAVWARRSDPGGKDEVGPASVPGPTPGDRVRPLSWVEDPVPGPGPIGAGHGPPANQAWPTGWTSHEDAAESDETSGTATEADPPAPLEPLPDAPLADLGLNVSRLLHYDETGETKYGDTAAVLDDAEALGARILRQPTAGNLLWPARLAVPVDDGTGSAIRAALDGEGVPEAVADLLWALVVHGHDATTGVSTPRVRVVLTLLHTRGVSETMLDERGEYVDGGYAPVGPEGEAAPAGSILALAWDPLHGGRTERWWDGTDWAFEEVELVRTGEPATLTSRPFDGDDVLYQGLDGRSPYKLKYLYLIGRTFGEILLDAQEEIVARWSAAGHDPALAPDVFDWVHAVELGNETNVMNLVYDPATDEHGSTIVGEVREDLTGYLWYRVMREVLRGFQVGLAGRQVDVWLPSLWSYELREADAVALGMPPSFSQLLEYERSLLAWFGMQPALEADDPEAPAPVDVSWISNQDYHFYHKSGSGAAILQLPAELDALRAEADALLVPYTGRAFTVSVCETGAAVHETSRDYAWIDLATTESTPVDASAYQQFQAREVWRRLSTALTGASVAAWHTPMSNLAYDSATGGPDVQEFSYMGLRVDSEYDIGGTADVAYTRPSYWAYQRIAEMLAYVDETGSRRGWWGEVVPWAARGSGDPWNQGLDAGSLDDMLVILRFHLGAASFRGQAWAYAYVIFLDPMCTAVEGASPYEDTSGGKTLACHPVSRGRVFRLPSVPAGIDQPAPSGSALAYPAGESPYATSSGAADWETYATMTSTGEPFTVVAYVHGPLAGRAVDRSQGDPVVLLSEVELSFT